MQSVPSALHNLPLCFQLTTLVPNSMNISQSDLHTIQSSLVDVWQEHIRQWNEDSHTSNVINHHNPDSNPDPASSSTNPPVVSSTVPSQKKGHVLRLIETGGVFCVKCGKQTKNMKHQRLKILNKPCEYCRITPKSLAYPSR